MPVENFDAEFERIETVLDDLQVDIDSCRRGIIASRASILLGLAVLVAVFTIAPAYGTATIVLGAITAMIGGAVWLGATRSTQDELQAKRDAAETRKSGLFDQIAQQNGWTPKGPDTYH